MNTLLHQMEFFILRFVGAGSRWLRATGGSRPEARRRWLAAVAAA